MLILAQLIGATAVIMGITFLASLTTLKGFIQFWQGGERLYLAGLIRILIGIFLVMAAAQCKIPLAVSLLGCLCLVGGMIIFIVGMERFKAMLHWWDTTPPHILRLITIIPIGIGLLLLYALS
jgi:hypothetical protein